MKPMFRTILATFVFFTLASTLYADDTEIYGAGSVDIEPNILIIFDTSGSMATKDVPSEYYSGDSTYSGPYIADAVYQRSWSHGTEPAIPSIFATSMM